MASRVELSINTSPFRRELARVHELLQRREAQMDEERETTVRWSVVLDDPRAELRDYMRNEPMTGRGATPAEAAADLKRKLDEVAAHANGNLDAVERSIDVLKKSQRVPATKRR
jgi:hypothetical protein